MVLSGLVGSKLLLQLWFTVITLITCTDLSINILVCDMFWFETYILKQLIVKLDIATMSVRGNEQLILFIQTTNDDNVWKWTVLK